MSQTRLPRARKEGSRPVRLKSTAKCEGVVVGAEARPLMGRAGFWGIGVGGPDGGRQEPGTISRRDMEELKSHSLGRDLVAVGR